MNKEPKNGKGYTTDINDIVRKEVSSHMRPLVEVVLIGQEEVIREVKKHSDFHKMVANNRVGITVLAVVDFFLAIGILLHWVTN